MHNPDNAKSLSRLVWQAGDVTSGLDQVAVEIPVAMVYNGISHAVMMATPSDLEDFAVGFSVSEGILESPDQLLDCEATRTEKGIELSLTITEGRFSSLKRRRRSLIGATGCGICGVESLDQAMQPARQVESEIQLTHAALQCALVALGERQELQKQTGAVHAAAWCDTDGALLLVREDVGRHNALDKLLGARFRMLEEVGPGFGLVTSRASYEMVFKAVSANIPLLASVSAPTSLAIELANQCDLTLVAFTRPGRHVIYAGANRLLE
jgi:FdhD protein